VYEDDLIFSSADEKARFESSKLGADRDTVATLDDSTSSDIGPALPPHLRQIQSPINSDSIGPQLPLHLRQSADETAQYEEQHIEADAEKRKVDTDVTEAIAAHAEKRQRLE
jgi:hypothetical protein